MDNRRGQAFVEYILTLAVISSLAYVGLRVFPRALGHYYNHLCLTRTGILGMLP